MSLTEIAINRPSLIVVIFGVLVGAGWFAYTKLGLELLPDFASPVVTITIPYPGASPSEVEQQVTKKVEDAVSGLENIEEVESKSVEGASVVIVHFLHGTNLSIAIQDAQRKVDNIRKDLPAEILPPSFSKISPNDQPVLSFTANSSLADRVFRQKIEDELLPQIQQVNGVAEITLLGGEKRQIRVNLNKSKLQYYNLSILQVTQAIKASNLDFPTGKVKAPDEQVTVRLAGKFENLDDLKNLVIITLPNGSPIRLSDIADVSDGVQDPPNISRFNGLNSISFLLKKQSDANAVEVSRLVRKKLEQLENQYTPIGLSFRVVSDTSEFTLQSVDAVVHDLQLAVVLVAAVMLLFLHSLRNSLIVLVSIPASLITTFGAMFLLGYTLNLMTLLAMSLVVGILVDDSIVVLENIYRHLEMGKNPRQAALDGRNEIGFTAMSITLVDVVVFLPITFTNVTISDVLRQFSFVVVISTLLSLFVCFTLTPWLASRFSKLEHLNPKNPFQWFLIGFENSLTAFTNRYTQLVAWFLRYKWVGFGLIFGLFFLTAKMMGLGILGQEFIKQGDQGKFFVRLEYNRNTPLLQNNLNTKKIEEMLLTQADVDYVFANIGGPYSGLGGTGLGAEHKTELTVQLKDGRKTPTEIYMMQVRKQIESKFPGVQVFVAVVGMVNSSTAPIEMIVGADDYAKALEAGKKLKQLAMEAEGANDVQISVDDANPEVRITIDRERMAQLGLSIGAVGATMQNAFFGDDNSKFRENGTEYEIQIMLDAFDRKNPDDVKDLTFVNNLGQSIALSQFASISRGTGPSMLERKNRRTAVTVTANAVGAGTGTVAGNIQKMIAQKPLPQGVEFHWGGEIKRQQEAFGALGIAMLASFILVYLIMVALYDDFIYPFVVLFSIPVALIGALLALNLSMNNMGIFTGMGMIMLLGLVAKNAILIVDFTNHLKEKGHSTREALLEAVSERMRPILMTTVAMVIGMLPIALAKGAGAEWKNGLAWVLIGGLTSSMFLTIVLIPMMYELVDQAKALLGRLFKRKTEKTTLVS